LHPIRLAYRVAMDAFYRFNADDGWAIASHIALSVLMSMFPFLILVTAIAGFIGSDWEKDLITKSSLGRTGQPDDIASIATFLASDDSYWLTGEQLLASGGLR